MDSNLDILITRVIDGRAEAADWAALDALGAADGGVWRELALAQKTDQLLNKAVGEAVEVASHVDLPANTHHIQAQERMHLRVSRVGAWGGWAAAAVLAFAFIARPTPTNTNVHEASLFPSAEDAYKAYMATGKTEGRVLGELPDRVVMNTQPAKDGKGYEVVFIRQIMERTRVDDMYKLSSDEGGNPHAVKVRFVVAGGKGPM